MNEVSQNWWSSLFFTAPKANSRSAFRWLVKTLFIAWMFNGLLWSSAWKQSRKMSLFYIFIRVMSRMVHSRIKYDNHTITFRLESSLTHTSSLKTKQLLQDMRCRLKDVAENLQLIVTNTWFSQRNKFTCSINSFLWKSLPWIPIKRALGKDKNDKLSLEITWNDLQTEENGSPSPGSEIH